MLFRSTSRSTGCAGPSATVTRRSVCSSSWRTTRRKAKRSRTSASQPTSASWTMRRKRIVSPRSLTASTLRSLRRICSESSYAKSTSSSTSRSRWASRSWSGRSCTCIGRTRRSRIGMARRFGCSTRIRTRYTSVKSEDLYKDILDVPILRELMDLSELPANHPSGVGDPNCPNKGILRKFKVVCHVIFVWRDCAIVT